MDRSLPSVSPSRSDDLAHVLRVEAGDVAGKDLGVSEQADEPVGGEVHAVDFGVAVPKGAPDVFLVLQDEAFGPFPVVDVADAVEPVL